MYSTIAKWAHELSNGWESLEGHPSPGWPATAVTDENVARAEAMIKEDWRIKCEEIGKALGVGRNALMTILHDRLNFWKLCARGCRECSHVRKKEIRATSCLELGHEFDDDSAGFRRCIVAGDETWIFWYHRETEAMSKEWRAKGGPASIKAEVARFAGTAMMTLFFDAE